MKDTSASIHQRLLNLGRKEKLDFNRLLNLYAHERLLARLSSSQYQKSFILKGGLYLYSKFGQAARPTRDLDLLAYQLRNDQNELLQLFREISGQDLNDGMRFDTNSLTAVVIKEDANYEGTRIKMTAYLGNAKTRLQIDIGFGDAIHPVPQDIDYPGLLELKGLKPLSILAYSLETVIAEKFQAMTILGTSNSRAKDFYDIFLISQEQSFNANTLSKTIFNTFTRRNSKLEDSYFLFTEKFANNQAMSLRWEQFQTKNPELIAPDTFKTVMATIEAFLRPIVQGQANGIWQPEQKMWLPTTPSSTLPK